MKLKRPTKKILLVSGIVVCFAFLSMAAFYITAIFPQLPEVLKPQHTSKVALTSDEEVKAICEQLKNKSILELHQASISYLENRDYKTCFNINKIIVQKVPKDKKNSAILAGAYTDIGD